MPSIPSRFAIFNGWNFNNVPGLQVYDLTTPGNQQRSLNIFALARRSARKVASAFYQDNQITIGVYIVAALTLKGGIDTLDQAVDLLVQNLQQIEGTLIVPRSGGVRQYTATYAGYTINSKGPYLDLTLTFECSDSYGYDTTYTVIQPATSYTAAAVNTQYTQGGGADLQAPIRQVKILAAGSNPATVTVGILGTGQKIAVTRTWVVNDVLVVDSQNKTVQVNGVDVNFTGAFLEVAPGLQTLTYQDTFTSRTVQLFDYVYNRYG